MDHTKGNKTKAAALLGVSKPVLTRAGFIIVFALLAGAARAQAPDTTYLNPYDLVPDKTRLAWFMEQPQTCPDRACVNVVRLDTFRVLANLEGVPVAVLANLSSGRQCLLWGDLQICRDEFPYTLTAQAERFESPFYTFVLIWNLVTQP